MSRTSARAARANQAVVGADDQHVVTEVTSKRLKAHLLWAYAAVFVGTCLAVGGALVANDDFQEAGPGQFIALAGGAVFVPGVIWAAVTKVRIWWNHG